MTKLEQIKQLLNQIEVITSSNEWLELVVNDEEVQDAITTLKDAINNIHIYFYSVCESSESDDSYGSTNFNEAVKMAKEGDKIYQCTLDENGIVTGYVDSWIIEDGVAVNDWLTRFN